MPSKNYAITACLLVVGTASANNQTYVVHKGDTIGTLAKKFNVPASELISENSLAHKHLKAGMKLHIAEPQKNFAHYKVQDGDNDWVLAHRLSTTIAQLKKLNPSVDWRHLRIGSELNVPGKVSANVPHFKSRFAVVNADSAIIRRGPSSDEDKITMVDTGTRVTVLNYENGWYQLRFPKGTVGWMRGDLLKAVAAPAVVAAKTKAKRVVVAAVAKRVIVAKATPASAKQVAAVQPKPVVAALTTAAVPAVSPSPTEAAVKDEAPKKVAKAGPTDQELLARAYHLRGTRYRYGGLSTSRGLDCSGFTTTVFGSAGIHLPRTSRSQSTIGVHVGRSDLEPGDLVFFRTGRSSRINHVGLYVGNGKFIHAASGYGAVRVDNLAGHYSHELATARRLPIVRHVVGAQSVQRPSPAKREPTGKPAVKAEPAVVKATVQPDPPELPAPSGTAPKKPDTH